MVTISVTVPQKYKGVELAVKSEVVRCFGNVLRRAFAIKLEFHQEGQNVAIYDGSKGIGPKTIAKLELGLANALACVRAACNNEISQNCEVNTEQKPKSKSPGMGF